MMWVCLGLIGVILFQQWLHSRERTRYDNTMGTIHRRTVAIADKVAVSVSEDGDYTPVGKVTYMDEQREWELQENATS